MTQTMKEMVETWRAAHAESCFDGSADHDAVAMLAVLDKHVGPMLAAAYFVGRSDQGKSDFRAHQYADSVLAAIRAALEE